MSTNKPEGMSTGVPAGVSDERYQRAWDSLSEADRQVLLATARNGYAPKVKPVLRRARKTQKAKVKRNAKAWKAQQKESAGKVSARSGR